MFRLNRIFLVPVTNRFEVFSEKNVVGDEDKFCASEQGSNNNRRKEREKEEEYVEKPFPKDDENKKESGEMNTEKEKEGGWSLVSKRGRKIRKPLRYIKEF